MKRLIQALVIIICALIAMQFFKAPRDNTSNDNQNHISTKYNVPEEVAAIMKNACNDCHSNLSEYPSYFNYQPMGWWLNSHIRGGKHHLNFSEFTTLKVAVQNHKFEEIIETVGEQKRMPMKSYTYFGLHPEAKLSDAQRTVLTSWAKTQMDSLKTWYPADSLVLKRGKS
jgi:hypothetical protein